MMLLMFKFVFEERVVFCLSFFFMYLYVLFIGIVVNSDIILKEIKILLLLILMLDNFLENCKELVIEYLL